MFALFPSEPTEATATAVTSGGLRAFGSPVAMAAAACGRLHKPNIYQYNTEFNLDARMGSVEAAMS